MKIATLSCICGRHSRQRKRYSLELVSFSWCASLLISPCDQYNTFISQAAKDVRGDDDTLVDVFERIECFFRRLEIYAQVPPTTEMMDTIIQIIVEVFSVLGIATKEIKQSRISE